MSAREAQVSPAAVRAHSIPRKPARRLLRAPSHILVACMPKSGSTFLSDVIAELPGFRRMELAPAYGRRQQELDEACLRGADPFNFVAQNHVQYSDFTAEMCRDYGVAPIVLVRDLLDVIVSLRDHLRNEGHVSPIFFAEPHHAALSDAELELMIARLALPWYVSFYMGWRRAPDALMVRYEELVEAPIQVVGRILAFAGAGVSAREIETAVQRVRGAGASRLNVGVAGRGAALRPEIARAVLELLAFYPEAGPDPFIESTRQRCADLLAGRPSPTQPVRNVLPPARPLHPLVRWWRKSGERIVMRGMIPLALAGLGLAYWIWPNDLVPDAARYGYADDVAFLLLTGVIAGRMTKYKPRAPRIRR